MDVESPRKIGPHKGLLEWLDSHHVEHELREHPETFTAEATARAEHLEPQRFAKVVGVAANDGREFVLVVDAEDHVDLAKAKHLLGVADVRLLTEPEFATVAPDCEPGTVPPIPELAGLPVYADFALRGSPELAFHAGSHRYSVHVDRSAWEVAAGITYGDLARDDGRPAWAR